MAKKKVKALTMKEASGLVLGISDDHTAEDNIKTVYAMMGLLIHSQEGQPGLKAMNKALQNIIKAEEKAPTKKTTKAPKKVAKKKATKKTK